MRTPHVRHATLLPLVIALCILVNASGSHAQPRPMLSIAYDYFPFSAVANPAADLLASADAPFSRSSASAATRP